MNMAGAMQLHRSRHLTTISRQKVYVRSYVWKHQTCSYTVEGDLAEIVQFWSFSIVSRQKVYVRSTG